MFIAIVDIAVSPDDRPAALEQLQKEAGEVRAMPGNIAFRAFPSPEDPARVTILHEWQDEDGFRAYAASPAFARSGEVLRPMVTEAPVSRRFRAELAEATN
jgi:quinol monooxygenase YgiN